MAYRLVVRSSEHGTWRINWCIGGEIGLTVGFDYSDSDPEPIGQAPWEVWIVNKTASKLPKSYLVHRDDEGFYWLSESDAREVAKACRAALRSAPKPMPEWAKTALHEGWKPPKGWKS